MFALIKSETGTLNYLTARMYYTSEAAEMAMMAEFRSAYEEFYDDTEGPRDEDNGYAYLAEAGRVVLSLDEPDTPEWAVVEVEW